MPSVTPGACACRWRHRATPGIAQHPARNASRSLRSSRAQKSAALLQYFVIFFIIEIWKKKKLLKLSAPWRRNTVSKSSGSWCVTPRMGCPPGTLPRRWGCPPRPCPPTSRSSNGRDSSGRGASSAAFCMPSIPRAFARSSPSSPRSAAAAARNSAGMARLRTHARGRTPPVGDRRRMERHHE